MPHQRSNSRPLKEKNIGICVVELTVRDILRLVTESCGVVSCCPSPIGTMQQ